MRLLATLLLVLMTAIFIVTTAVEVDWPWIPYVSAFAEAGMVGACADWFAIVTVSLFRSSRGEYELNRRSIRVSGPRGGEGFLRFGDQVV